MTGLVHILEFPQNSDQKKKFSQSKRHKEKKLEIVFILNVQPPCPQNGLVVEYVYFGLV